MSDHVKPPPLLVWLFAALIMALVVYLTCDNDPPPVSPSPVTDEDRFEMVVLPVHDTLEARGKDGVVVRVETTEC
jgi:hypothetical protein